jgi:sugar phosphate isomerase/epimerase
MTAGARPRSGLCSVSFRQLAPDAILDLVVETGIEAIEWGADVHVPPGELAVADRLARRCAEAGVLTPSYGSYLLAGEFDQPVTAVLETAATLGATTVRVWAGTVAPADADAMTRQRVAGHLASLVDRARAYGVDIAVEFHDGTLTDDAASTLELLADVADDRLRSYWQPRGGDPLERSLSELAALGDRLAHLHVFWWDGAHTRLPLADGHDLWRRVVAHTESMTADYERFAFLEFVPDDDVDAFRRDAATLRQLLDS